MRLSEHFRDGVIDWNSALVRLDERGFTVIPAVLAQSACEELAAGYGDDRQFRSRIEMERYAFGRGEYKYFNYPLPLGRRKDPICVLSSSRAAGERMAR